MRRLLPQLIAVAAVGLAFGVVYRYFLDDPSEASVANYLRSGVHGMSVAFAALGTILYFNLRASRWLRTWPLLAEIALRALVMAITIAAVIAGLEVVIYGRPLTSAWLSSDFPRILAMAFVLSVLVGAIFELVRLIGGRVLLNVILGRYRHPTREDRVMMFLDLANSTSLAEALGEVRMQELLTRFFFDIDEPIVAHGGEVHAYVGDEVIVSWPLTTEVLGGACLDCFFAVRDRIEERGGSYRYQFGSAPRFRAGLHAGPVVISECGIPTPNRLFWRHDERDGAASGALQGSRPAAARLRRPPEARPPRPGPSGRRAGTGGVARTRGVGGDLRRRARPCWSDWLERMPSCPRAPPFAGSGHWDVALSGMVDGRMRLLSAEGALVFTKACELGLEGIVSKRAGSRYRSGTSRQWLKSKNPAFMRGWRRASSRWMRKASRLPWSIPASRDVAST